MIDKTQHLAGRSMNAAAPVLNALAFVVFCLATSESRAQALKPYAPEGIPFRPEITGFYGWQFWGGVEASEGKVSIKAADAWGGAIDIPTPAGVHVELVYYREDSRVELKDRITGVTSTLFDMSINYYQIGAIRGLSRGNVMPFGIFTLGATEFNPKPSDLSSEWRFSITLGLGAKIYASERIGLRVQGNLLMPIQWGGGGLWCGTGGCSVGVGGGSGILQGNVLGGLFVIL